VKNLGPSGIRCGFCVVFFLSIILAFTSHATGSSGTLTPNPLNINFGPVPVGSSQMQSVTLANNGGPKVTITQAIVSGTGFALSGLSVPLTLAGGQSVKCTVTFAPQATGTDSGSLWISFTTQGSNGKGGSGSTGLTVPVSGTAVSLGQLSPNPSSLSFGNIQVGTSQSQWETLTNIGGSSVTISQVTDAGAGFSVSGLNLPTTLAPNQSLTFSTTFAPQIATSATGTITVSSNASNPTLTIGQTGTGTAQGQLTVSPPSANFGSVTVGTSASQTGTLSATGASVTVSSVRVSNPEFSLTGVGFPLTIAAGQSVPIAVAFTPQASGTASAQLSFTSNASTSSPESLTGDGVAPQHSVSLSWAASTSLVVGYNVYRGGTSGGPYTIINSALDSSTSYTDSSVQAGQTYYYVTTAVDSTGTESSYSNQAQAVIPSP
jgi:Abnormal spindle-like microcephaly-assoc'd, ASPM-SPD-2-Hydin/HYDIN/CFA65/VesB-like, Ig-like domain